ncbi:MAG: septum formation initiator family protein [Myxococcota bacterium]
MNLSVPTKLALTTSIVLVGGLVGTALFGADGLVRHEQLKTELHRVRSLNDKLRAENRRLAVERRALRHDPVYIDAVIRDDLGYIRSDEVILKFNPDESD